MPDTFHAEPDEPDAASARTRSRSAPYPSVWLDSVEVRLAGDRDGDGYHSRIAITLDVDTDAGFAEVYAGIALVDGAGRVAVAYDTDAFGVEDRVSWDATTVEFELLDDFPTDRYGLHVEVRDAYYGDALDGVGPNEFSSLGRLRLEGTRRDGHGHGYEIGYGVGFSSGVGGYSSGYGGVRDDGYAATYGAVSYTGAAGPLALAALVGAVALVRLGRRARR